jgi:ATP sulfurylase
VKFYCPDCRQAVCPDCLPKHKAHPFVASSHEFREQKLAEVKELRNVVQTRQNELMDFIVKLKERKKEMKKNQAMQKGLLDECFGEIRKCLDFYQ